MRPRTVPPPVINPQAYAPTAWVDGVTPVNAVNLNKLENGLQAVASVALPADTVVAAATRIIANKLQGADANNAFRFMGDGKHEWGPGGATALDTNLYRTAGPPIGLKTDGPFSSADRVDAYIGLATQVSILALAGKPNIYFGNGGDTNLYRSAAGALKTDGDFYAKTLQTLNYTQAGVGSALGGYAFLTQATADTGYRWVVTNDGKMYWAPGNGTGDISLYREGAGVLRATGHLVAEGQVQSFRGASGQLALGTIGGTPTGAPQILFGSAADTNLYRQSAGYLMTDTSLVIKKVLYVDYGNTGDRLYWGSAGDAMIYRSAAGVLRTDAYFQVYYGINLDLGNGGARLNFGTTADTNLYRVAAGVLQTDGTMLVGNNLYVNGYIRYMAPALEESAVSGTNVRRIVILKGDGSFGGWIPVYN